jgi:hypothetical protein
MCKPLRDHIVTATLRAPVILGCSSVYLSVRSSEHHGGELQLKPNATKNCIDFSGKSGLEIKHRKQP